MEVLGGVFPFHNNTKDIFPELWAGKPYKDRHWSSDILCRALCVFICTDFSSTNPKDPFVKTTSRVLWLTAEEASLKSDRTKKSCLLNSPRCPNHSALAHVRLTSQTVLTSLNGHCCCKLLCFCLNSLIVCPEKMVYLGGCWLGLNGAQQEYSPNSD